MALVERVRRVTLRACVSSVALRLLARMPPLVAEARRGTVAVAVTDSPEVRHQACLTVVAVLARARMALTVHRARVALAVLVSRRALPARRLPTAVEVAVAALPLGLLVVRAAAAQGVPQVVQAERMAQRTQAAVAVEP